MIGIEWRAVRRAFISLAEEMEKKPDMKTGRFLVLQKVKDLEFNPPRSNIRL